MSDYVGALKYRAECNRAHERVNEASADLRTALAEARRIGDSRAETLAADLESLERVLQARLRETPQGRAVTAIEEAVRSPALRIPTFTLDASGHARVLSFIGTGSTFVPKDVFGARNALAYDVKPIVLAGGRARIQFHDRKGWEIFGLKAGYETDRAFQSGGSISDVNGLAQQLGVQGVAADVIDASLAVYGVGIEGELATFTNGRVQVQDVATGTPYADAPLRFSRRRLEATFNLTQRLGKAETPILDADRNAWIARAVYYDVELPRIAYLTQQDTASSREIVIAESSPQNIRVAFGAVGGSFRWAMLSGRAGRLGSEFTLLAGGGNVRFSMPARLGVAESPTNRVKLSEAAFALVTRIGVTGELRFMVGEDVAFFLGGSLSAEQYYAEASVPGSTSGSVGFADAFLSAMVFGSLRYGSPPPPPPRQ